jgi:phosphohistidine swiveling domain-containing protein
MELKEVEVVTETTAEQVLGSFLGDEAFPIQWEEGEAELLWILDDLHCPNPVSPMFFDIGGWWLTCDHMFRRFGTPFASDWLVKNVNGYVYHAAVPATAGLRVESTEYGARYVARVPRDADYPARMGAYLGWVLPHYAENFLDWWRDRLRPEIERNFEHLDRHRTDGAGLLELAVLLEDAIDIHDRHWKIHWLLNFAQFSATMGLNATIGEVKGDVDSTLVGRLQSSVADRNWDSIEALWRMKEEIKDDAELRSAFAGDSAARIGSALESSERGRRFLSERLSPYRLEFGNKAIWSHEFVYPTWRENPAPILEALRGYLETDYDYASSLEAVKADLEGAKRELLEGVPEGEGRTQLVEALELSLRMNPLTPDHHFFIDQATNAHLRLVLVAIGRKLAEAGVLADAEDVVFLRYNELRVLVASSQALDARSLVADRRGERERASAIRPPAWIGTATESQLNFPYYTLWGFPEKFHRKPPERLDEIHGLPGSPGVIEGTARNVSSLDEFDEVRSGEILVCQMTNPAWVVLFTKIGGLVTDAGGVASHPAVVAREFGLPAVVGTSVATERIRTGDRVRVNGSTGVVERFDQ